jgi:integrase
VAKVQPGPLAIRKGGFVLRSHQPFALELRGGIYRVVFYVGPERFRFSTGTSDSVEAGKKALTIWSRYTQAAGKLPAGTQDRLALKQHVANWLEHLEGRAGEFRENYVNRREIDTTYFLKKWERLSDVTPQAWEVLKRELHAGPLGWRSIALVANTLRHFLRWCEETIEGYTAPKIDSPPQKLVRLEQAGRAAMTEVQRDLFLKTLSGMGERADDRLYASRAHRIYRVLFWTAMRKGELEALCPNWIDWTAETITIPAKDDKAGHEEVIDLHPMARLALSEEQATHDPLPLEKPLFGHFDLRMIFKATCVKAGIKTPGLTAHHVTRHTCATLAAEHAPTLGALMSIGRWKSPQVAARYLHADLKAARSALRKL